MAKKIRKSKGRGSKPKAKVSSKEEATPYDRARAAIYLKYEEDSYQKVMGHIDKSRNVLQEYSDAIHDLHMEKEYPDNYEEYKMEHIRKIQKQEHQTNKSTTKEKVKQTQDEPRLAAQIVLTEKNGD